jgi:acyl dehydratase
MSTGPTSPSIGSAVTATPVENLSRSLLVQYAGASGDFNPLHTDEIYAREVVGARTVMAHGMLTMGLTATVLTRVVGEGTLTYFGGRFLGPVWPGDSLRVEVVVTDVDGDQWELAVTTSNQRDEPVFSGQAKARLADREPDRAPAG